MKKLIELYFERLSNFERKEPTSVAIPFKKGLVDNVKKLVINDGQNLVDSQKIATAKWSDGSVKWALVKFFAELDGKNDKTYFCEIGNEIKENKKPIKTTEEESCLVIDNGRLLVKLNNEGDIFNYIKREDDEYFQKDIIGPVLNGVYKAKLTEKFKVIENGEVSAIVQGKGSHFAENGNSLLDFMINIEFYYGCDYFKLDYRIINREKLESVKINSLEFIINKNGNKLVSGISNYRTAFTESDEEIYSEITADTLIYEANEHFPEVFYGTFFGDTTNEKGGVCATIYQAQQNFPKALEINKNSLKIQLIPKKSDIDIEFFRGMARNQTIFLHFHSAEESKEKLNLRSLQFQMPDRAVLSSKVYEEAEVFPKLYLEKNEKIRKIENAMTMKMDKRGKAYGFLHWGDSADMHYTTQGRGNGQLVWTNNEYDFPHTAMLMYARNGQRRYLDYMLTAARHWADVDVCHDSDDEIRQGAQIIHSANHISGKVEISHEWVEGLFDYYHETGDRFAYDTAIEIGKNIKRNLKLPKYHHDGEINARETGWALRALVALYIETNDEAWLEDADFIVGHFESWEKRYGKWLAPYTDHTIIRVPFMISIAVGSLMRYYSIRENDKIRDMILRAVDDMLENCMLENGLFYYKEIPSLERLGNNTTVLEALTYAYEFTGDDKYLRAGIETFKNYINEGASGSYGGGKKQFGDAVITAGPGTKGIAQSYFPVMSFYTAAVRAGFSAEELLLSL